MVSNTCSGKSRGWAGEVSKVTSWLFLTGARAVRPPRLKELGVTHVVNATAELPEMRLDGIEVTTVKISDSQTASLQPFLHQTADKLLDVRLKEGKALIHCIAGVSRSPTIVLAYLIKHEGFSLRDAFLRVKGVRPVVRPNTNFFKQLVEFEEEIRGRRSVEFIQIPGSTLSIPDVCEDEIKLINSRSWTQMIKARRNFEKHFA